MLPFTVDGNELPVFVVNNVYDKLLEWVFRDVRCDTDKFHEQRAMQVLPGRSLQSWRMKHPRTARGVYSDIDLHLQVGNRLES